MGGVAGIKLPAFVERGHPYNPRDPSGPVSPGLNSRPSLSAGIDHQGSRALDGVAGIKLPAFVERGSTMVRITVLVAVSPGLNSRPSLSVVPDQARFLNCRVSPGLNSRPSLSDGKPSMTGHSLSRVAGIKLPAFVERRSRKKPANPRMSCRRD